MGHFAWVEMLRLRMKVASLLHASLSMTVAASFFPDSLLPFDTANRPNVPCLAFAECEKMTFPTVAATASLGAALDGP
jgi:hypothetical protein